MLHGKYHGGVYRLVKQNRKALRKGTRRLLPDPFFIQGEIPVFGFQSSANSLAFRSAGRTAR